MCHRIFCKRVQKKKCKVIGVDINRDAIKEAKKYCDKVILGNLDSLNKEIIPKQRFDYILLLDVIEHLLHSSDLLHTLKPYLNKTGKLIISTPNIAHVSIRLKLLTGNFDYNEYGILDKNHIHFFTINSLRDMLLSEGYKIEIINVSADFGQIPLIGRLLRYIPKHIQWHITKVAPTLLGVQLLAIVNL
jgi:O-antigen biosynthesis protein